MALAWLYVFPYHDDVNNPNENVRAYQTMAIVETGHTPIDPLIARYGWVNDTAGREVVQADGSKVFHQYAGKAPGTPLIGIAPYWLVRKVTLSRWGREPTRPEAIYWLRLLTVVLPSIGLLWLFRAWLAPRVGEAIAAQAVVAYGLGTMATPYTMSFASHQQTAIGLFTGWLCARRAALADHAGLSAPTVALWLFGAGLGGGMAALVEYPLALAVGCLGAYVVWTLRRRALVVCFVAGGVPPLVAMGAFHKAAFGKVMTTAYSHLANPTFARETAEGFFGLVKPSTESLTGTLVALDYGLFVFSPFLAVGLCAAVVAWIAPRALAAQGDARPQLVRADAVLAVVLFAVMVLFNASMNIWRAGWCVGPRYIAVLPPFLAAWSALGVKALTSDKRPWRADVVVGVAGALALFGVTLSGLAGLTFPHLPPTVRNPVFELIVPVLESGLLPYHAGMLVGLPGYAGIVPLVVVIAVAAWFATGAATWRLLRVPVAASLFALAIVPYSRVKSDPAAVAEDKALIVRTWSPKAAPPPRPTPPAER